MPQSILEWTVFSVLVLGALLLDLFVFQRKAHEIGLREALTGSAVWVGLALLFTVGLPGVARPALVTEAERLTQAGYTRLAKLTYFAAGVTPVTTTAPAAQPPARPL